jgi:hypothetical protein
MEDKPMFNYVYRWLTGTDVAEVEADDGFDDGDCAARAVWTEYSDEVSHEPIDYFCETDHRMIQAGIDDGTVTPWRKGPGGEQWYKRRARTIHGVPE